MSARFHGRCSDVMKYYRLALLGFGNVGQAFLRLLQRKKELLQQDYGIGFTITGITTARHGTAIDQKGIDADRALRLISCGGSLDQLSTGLSIADPLEFIRTCSATVLFENTPVSYTDGQPALNYLRAALRLGLHAITANKGPVVYGFHELTALAMQHGCKFFFESAVMDGAPIFSLFRECLPATNLYSFHGILNSTTNLILSRMEEGDTFEAAVAYAQSIGLAETDPSGDIDGWDAAVKVSALVTVLMDIPLKPVDVMRTGIRSLTPENISQARRQAQRWKLVCTARREGNRVSAQVAPELVDADSPLYGVNGTSSIITFETNVLPQLSIVEGNPGPETTAYGLLADFINATR
jgi:homoserine dehydrogenase